MHSESTSFSISSGSLHARKKNVNQLALFVSLIYVKYWHEELTGTRALLSDLENVVSSGEITPWRSWTRGKNSSKPSPMVFVRTSYWTSFFDNRTDASTKRRMAQNLQLPRNDDCPCCVGIPAADVEKDAVLICYKEDIDPL